MPTGEPIVRRATPADDAALKALIERAYRGVSSTRSWSHEGGLPSGPRIAIERLRELIGAASSYLAVAEQGAALVASALVEPVRSRRCRIGLVSVDPDQQARGLGHAMIAHAEAVAARLFGATCVEMDVLEHKTRLRGFYERRGYRATAERRPYPILGRDAAFVVYEKPLG